MCRNPVPRRPVASFVAEMRRASSASASPLLDERSEKRSKSRYFIPEASAQSVMIRFRIELRSPPAYGLRSGSTIAAASFDG